MVQEWKRDEQPTNIGLPRRITSFFPGHSTFLLGETGLTTVERCFYSKKEKKKRGEKKTRNDAHPRDSIEIRFPPANNRKNAAWRCRVVVWLVQPAN